MSENPLISIIVPVYNTESYLRNCINSVLKQKYQNWELLLVDDGSTDTSGKMCDEFAANDSRIHVEHKQNTGVSDTRNHGIDTAKGEWIFFLDSDDELFPDSLSSMMEWSKDADMVVGVFKMNITDPTRTAQEDSKANKFVDKIVKPKVFVKCLMDKQLALAPTVFPKLYKTEIIRKNSLRFDANIYYAEDQLFLAQYLCCKETSKIRVNNTRPVYLYNIWSGNATSKMSKQYNDRLFTDFVGYYKIYETYNKAFHDKRIDAWAKLKAYTSGRYVQDLICDIDSVTVERRKYLEESLDRLTDKGKDLHVIKRYNAERALIAMKHKAAEMNRYDRIHFVNKWLHSKEADYECLNERWKKLYILSQVLGSFGVRLVIDKIRFGI